MAFLEFIIGVLAEGILMLIALLISFNSEHPIITTIIAFFVSSGFLSVVFLTISYLFFGGAL